MFDSQRHDSRAYATTTFDSWEHGWRSLLLRRMTHRPEAEDVVIPAVSDQYVTLVLAGGAEVESLNGGGRRVARSAPGALSMTAPGNPTHVRWRSIAAQPIESVDLHLPASTTARLVEDLWDRDPRHVTFPDTLSTTDPVLEEILRGLLSAATDGLPDLYAETAAEFLAVHTLTRHARLPAPRPAGRDDERIRRARAWLRANFDRPLSLTDVAAEVGMSRYHVLRTFRSQTGETPYRFLTRLRVERAREELIGGRLPIGEIAFRTGFSSAAHLSTAFRRLTGVSPSAFRAERLPRSVR